jgi:hypothetical protein
MRDSIGRFSLAFRQIPPVSSVLIADYGRESQKTYSAYLKGVLSPSE